MEHIYKAGDKIELAVSEEWFADNVYYGEFMLHDCFVDGVATIKSGNDEVAGFVEIAGTVLVDGTEHHNTLFRCELKYIKHYVEPKQAEETNLLSKINGMMQFIKRVSNARSVSILMSDDEQLTIRIESNKSACLLYTSPSPRDRTRSRMPSSA